jgi:hypothetical protein
METSRICCITDYLINLLVVFYELSKFENFISDVVFRRKGTSADFRCVQLWFNTIVQQLKLFSIELLFTHDYLFEAFQ